MATLPVQIVSSLKRTLPFLHYSVSQSSEVQ
jgi:hypothetical protein